jgi:hypothetical protein
MRDPPYPCRGISPFPFRTRAPPAVVQNRTKNVRTAPALLRSDSNHVPAASAEESFFPKNARAAPVGVPGDSKNVTAGAAEVLGESNRVPAAPAEEFFVSKNSRAAPVGTNFILFWTSFTPRKAFFALVGDGTFRRSEKGDRPSALLLARLATPSAPRDAVRSYFSHAASEPLSIASGIVRSRIPGRRLELLRWDLPFKRRGVPSRRVGLVRRPPLPTVLLLPYH